MILSQEARAGKGRTLPCGGGSVENGICKIIHMHNYSYDGGRKTFHKFSTFLANHRYQDDKDYSVRTVKYSTSHWSIWNLLFSKSLVRILIIRGSVVICMRGPSFLKEPRHGKMISTMVLPSICHLRWSQQNIIPIQYRPNWPVRSHYSKISRWCTLTEISNHQS